MTKRKPAPRTSLITRTTCRVCGCSHLARGGQLIVPLPEVRVVGAS